jgi:hypothetical protein
MDSAVRHWYPDKPEQENYPHRGDANLQRWLHFQCFPGTFTPGSCHLAGLTLVMPRAELNVDARFALKRKHLSFRSFETTIASGMGVRPFLPSRAKRTARVQP